MDATTLMTFPEKLRHLREVAGLTQQQLAERAGVPLASVRNYEQGKRQPGWAGLFHLARALGVSSEEFSDCDEVKPAKPRRGK